MNPVMSENPSRIEEAQQLYLDRISEFDEMEKEAESKLEDKLIFTPYSFDELLKMPSKEWLLDQVFGAGDIGMIYGPPGCGKTFVVIDMIVSLCKGQKWANEFDVTRCLNVAYCAGEGIGGLPSRFAAIAKHYDITNLDNFSFYPIPPQLYDDNATAKIDDFCNEWKARQDAKEVAPLDVLIIDTLHTATVAADENSAQHMGKALHSR